MQQSYASNEHWARWLRMCEIDPMYSDWKLINVPQRMIPLSKHPHLGKNDLDYIQWSIRASTLLPLASQAYGGEELLCGGLTIWRRRVGWTWFGRMSYSKPINDNFFDHRHAVLTAVAMLVKRLFIEHYDSVHVTSIRDRLQLFSVSRLKYNAFHLPIGFMDRACLCMKLSLM